MTFSQNATVTLDPPPIVVVRPRMCARCGTTVARVGSLCTLCDEDIERSESREFPVANEPTCPVDGFVLNRVGGCDECARNNWGPVAR